MTTLIALQCDSGVSPECEGYSKTFPTKKGARNHAYRQGWKRIGGMDICPKCQRRTLTVLWKESAEREAGC